MSQLRSTNFFSEHSIAIRKQHHQGEVKRHDHDFFEFVYVKQGFAVHKCNGISSILTPGDIFGIFPNNYHSYLRPKNNTIYNCLFKKESLGYDFEEISKLPGLDNRLTFNCSKCWNRVHMNPAKSSKIEHILERMIVEGENKKIGWELRLKSSLIEFLVLFSRAHESQYANSNVLSKKHSDKMFEALTYLDDYHTDTICIQDIATKLDMNVDYFSRIFKQSTGLTPSEYIRNIRLAQAVELLSNTDLPIAYISTEVGFNDPAYFTRQFKKFLGVSPSSYRNQQEF